MKLSFQKNQILWKPAESTLPMETVQRSSLFGGVILSLFSLAWFGGLLAIIVLATLKQGSNIPTSIMLLLFASPGLFSLYIGLSMMVSK